MFRHAGRRAWFGAALGFLFVVLLVPAVLASVATPAAATGTTTAVVTASTPTTAFPSPIRHVILIVDENEAPGEVMAHAPYFNELATHYAQAGYMYAIRPDSEPAYLAMTSGIAPDRFLVGGYKALNLGDLTTAAGETWGSYLQAMPSNCYTGGDNTTTGYKQTHNPFIQYSDIVSAKTKMSADCAAHVQTLNEWNQTVANGTIPNFSLIVPDMLDDMNNSGFTAGNAWLQSFIPTIQNQPWYSSTVVFITFDESRTPAITWNGTTGGLVSFVAVSPYARLGYNSTVNYTQYSILTTTEWLLGLGSTGQNDSFASFPPMKDLFTFTSGAGASYAVSGTVTDNATAAPIAGATVSVSGGGQTGTVTTSSSGTFSFNLPNGSYDFSASAAGFLPGHLLASVDGSAESGLVVALNPVPPGEYSISGTVSSPTGPIAGATVTYSDSGPAGELGVTTGSNGAYSVLVTNGTYVMTASAYGYHALTNPSVPVNGANVGGVNFVLQPYTYGVSGTVTAQSNGAPVVGAAVYLNLTTGSGPSASLVTSSSGAFATSLANGTYSVVVTAPGYEKYSSTFQVDGGLVQLSIQLVSPPSGSGTTSLMSELTQPWVIALIIAVIAAAAAGTYVLTRKKTPPTTGTNAPAGPQSPPTGPAK